MGSGKSTLMINRSYLQIIIGTGICDVVQQYFNVQPLMYLLCDFLHRLFFGVSALA